MYSKKNVLYMPALFYVYCEKIFRGAHIFQEEKHFFVSWKALLFSKIGIVINRNTMILERNEIFKKAKRLSKYVFL